MFFRKKKECKHLFHDIGLDRYGFYVLWCETCDSKFKFRDEKEKSIELRISKLRKELNDTKKEIPFSQKFSQMDERARREVIRVMREENES